MAGQEVDAASLQRTLDHYLVAAYGDPAHPDRARAVALAEANALSHIAEKLAMLGEVEFITEEGILDTSCIYHVKGEEEEVVVYVCTAVPYAAVTRAVEGRWTNPALPNDDGWPGRVAHVLAVCGIFVLPGEVCSARSSIIDEGSGAHLSYFEALFQTELEDLPLPG